jgi:hypothetical protein
MEQNFLSSTRILVCMKKNCQSLNEFGSDLCRRRTLEDREKININYVGHMPPPAPPAEFLCGHSEDMIVYLQEERSNCLCRVGFVDVSVVSDEFGHRTSDRRFIPLTHDELAGIPRQEVGDESNFLCPKRRDWANESKIQKCVAVEHDGKTLLVDHFGAVLNLEGEEVPLKIEIPLPGLPGSERVIYYPNSNGNFQGRSFFYRDNKKAPESIRKFEKIIFRHSPEVKLEIGEFEILILQTLIDSSDCGHQSDIKILRAGDKIAKHTQGKNKFLLKPGEGVDLPESALYGGGWHTQKFSFLNKGGQMIKYLTDGREFAIRQAKTLVSSGLSGDDAWKVIKAAGPGAAVKGFEYGTNLSKLFPEKVDTLLTILKQSGPPKSPGWCRTEGVIKSLGFPIPEAKNSGEFFRILAGARQVIQLVRQGKLRLVK